MIKKTSWKNVCEGVWHMK